MYNGGLQKDREKGLTSVNRNVEDLRMEGCPPNLSDPSGVEPIDTLKVRPREGRHEGQGIESAHLTICGYEQFDPVGVME